MTRLLKVCHRAAQPKTVAPPKHEVKLHSLEKQSKDTTLSTVFQKKLMVSTKNGYRLLPLEQVEALVANGNYTKICLHRGEQIFLSKTMKTFLTKLDARFFRIHNSTMINLEYIQEVNKKDSCVLMDSGQSYPIARSRKHAFLELLKRHWD